MSNASKHFCAWCTASSDKKYIASECRTTSSIKNNYIKWITEKGGQKKFAMNYKNCSNAPLITVDDNAPIIHFIAPPELHILIGVVTYLYSKLESECPEIADKWLTECNLKFFHGQKQFNGNTSRQLLKKCCFLAKLSPG